MQDGRDKVYINKAFRGISRGGVGGGGREGEREKGEVGVVVIIQLLINAWQ